MQMINMLARILWTEQLTLLTGCGNRMVAVYQHSCAHRVSKQLKRRSQMAQAVAFDVWTQYSQHCHDLRVRIQQMMTRAAHAKLRGAFAGWAQWAAASAGNLRHALG